MARPKIPIDESKVEKLAAVGASIPEIAAELAPEGKKSLNHKTIERRFGYLLKKGAEKRNLRIRSVLVKEALAGNTPVLIFACKTLLGLKEHDPVSINVSATATGGSIQISDDDRKRLEELASNIRTRIFKRPHSTLVPSGNGDVTQN
jgi:hypothetical protein